MTFVFSIHWNFTMTRLTHEQRLQIVEIYFQNQCSVKNVFRTLRSSYGVHNRPTEHTVRETINKLRFSFTLLDLHPPIRVRRGHTASNTIDLLKENFHEQIISRNRPVNWPPRSCDLTLLDYFLWGYVKSLFYLDKLQSIDALEANITCDINVIPADMLERVLGN